MKNTVTQDELAESMEEEIKKIKSLRETVDMQLELIEKLQEQIHKLSMENKRLKSKEKQDESQS
jgi:uncharacterized coiled-coil DUF342 family protein